MGADTAAETGDRSASDFWKLVLGSIGVVYGDIGTSPLYALREALHAAGRDGLAEREVIGIVSLLLWSLLALAQRAVGKRTALLFVFGVAGAALFYGDAAITPAISVLSAVEGLKLVTPALDPFVLPITVTILVALFWVQGHGTERVSAFFGPITLVWFIVLAVLGIMHAGDRPAIFGALLPTAAIGFLVEHGWARLRSWARSSSP